MAMKDYAIVSRLKVDPGAAADELASAYRDAGCSMRAMSKKYGCVEQTIARWVRLADAKLRAAGKPLLSPRFAKIRAQALKEGWHHDGYRQGGRPAGVPGAKKSRKKAQKAA
jgi:hypothetical protein